MNQEAILKKRTAYTNITGRCPLCERELPTGPERSIVEDQGACSQCWYVADSDEVPPGFNHTRGSLELWPPQGGIPASGYYLVMPAITHPKFDRYGDVMGE